MLRDVALVAAEDLELHLASVLQEAPLEEDAHRLRHAPDIVVLAKERDEPAREAVDEARVPRVDEVAEQPIPRRDEKLPKAEGMEVERVHLPDGVPAALVHGDAQQRAGRSHRVPGRILAEVLEGGERLRACLDLVEDNEGASLGHDLPRLELDGRDDAGDVVAQLELLAHLRIVVEIHVRNVLELRPTKLLEQPRLAHLTRAVEDERLAAGPVLPGDEFVHEESFHASSSPKIATALFSHRMAKIRL